MRRVDPVLVAYITRVTLFACTYLYRNTHIGPEVVAVNGTRDGPEYPVAYTCLEWEEKAGMVQRNRATEEATSRREATLHCVSTDE